VARSTRETDDEDKVAPPMVQAHRESALRIQWGGTTSKDYSNEVRLHRESKISEGSYFIQRKYTLKYRWKRGIFQDHQEGVMG
jgi:hypothetical protein